MGCGMFCGKFIFQGVCMKLVCGVAIFAKDKGSLGRREQFHILSQGETPFIHPLNILLKRGLWANEVDVEVAFGVYNPVSGYSRLLGSRMSVADCFGVVNGCLEFIVELTSGVAANFASQKP